MTSPLEFRMRGASTGLMVTQRDFRGKVVMVYFGYTNCPDVCPDTLFKVRKIFERLGPDAQHFVFLFVTVDPQRDTPAILKKYLALFNPHLIGLRGSANQLFRLARRYRVVFSVHRSKKPEQYTVVHSSLIYVFGRRGNARFVISDLGLDPHPNIPGIVADLKHVDHTTPRNGLLTWLAKFD